MYSHRAATAVMLNDGSEKLGHGGGCATARGRVEPGLE